MALTSPVPIVTGPLRYSDGLHRKTAPIWIVHTAVAHSARAGRRIRRNARAHRAIPVLAGVVIGAAITATVLR